VGLWVRGVLVVWLFGDLDMVTREIDAFSNKSGRGSSNQACKSMTGAQMLMKEERYMKIKQHDARANSVHSVEQPRLLWVSSISDSGSLCVGEPATGCDS